MFLPQSRFIYKGVFATSMLLKLTKSFRLKGVIKLYFTGRVSCSPGKVIFYFDVWAKYFAFTSLTLCGIS